MADASPSHLLGFVDVEKVLGRLGEVSKTIVLIGGQAIAFWAHFFQLTDRPLTSKDIDFCGDEDAARLCAVRLNGHARIPTVDDVTPNSAIVDFIDDEGVIRHIDFLDQPHGLNTRAVHDLAQEFVVHDSNGADVGTFLVMHPLHCVISRASNTAFLPGYDTAHALEQLRVSVAILRSFLERVVLAATEPRQRDALKLVHRLYRFSHNNPAALEVNAKHHVDVFQAAPAGGFGLPEKYAHLDYPQMIQRLSARRERFGRANSS